MVLSILTTSAQKAGKVDAKTLEILHTYEDTLALMGYAVINDSLPEYRFGTCKKLITSLKTALKLQNSFNYPFERLKSVSIQYPQDSSFRIFTWQLYVNKDEYRYFGAIQMNTPDLKLIPLIDRSFELTGNLEQIVYGADNWYGAVYYRLMEVDAPSGKYYLLFGFDGYEFFQKRKLIDVLTFNENGQPVFGAPVFLSNKEDGGSARSKNRVLLEYSAEASVKMNYDEIMGKIVFDNLMDINGQYGEGPTKIPDGTYQGYELKDGYWLHITKIFNLILDEPPIPEPKLGGVKKDIFGNK
ncbi:MAG: hypothetical protein DHS20C18_17830 [Saprospiraceae bacterium]|nr:MAG: hypothetical protein DHS20C18_17830 [Saprospiraceae bacterium]